MSSRAIPISAASSTPKLLGSPSFSNHVPAPARHRTHCQGRLATLSESFEPAAPCRRAGRRLRKDGHDYAGRAGAELPTNLYSLLRRSVASRKSYRATGHQLERSQPCQIDFRESCWPCCWRLATIGVSTHQRTAPATDATSRAVAAAEAFLATLDQSQRAKANIGLNEKTRDSLVEPSVGHHDAGRRDRAEWPQARQYDTGAGKSRARARRDRR